MINLPTREMRAGDVPALPPAIGCQNECTFLRAHQHSDVTHSDPHVSNGFQEYQLRRALSMREERKSPANGSRPASRHVEESFRGHEASPSIDGAPRLAILHAWVWAPNPDGVFVTDNWTLPFVRLGLVLPNADDRNASRAASLVTDAEYYHKHWPSRSRRAVTNERGSTPSSTATLARQTARWRPP